jgi:hypothetical protein
MLRRFRIVILLILVGCGVGLFLWLKPDRILGPAAAIIDKAETLEVFRLMPDQGLRLTAATSPTNQPHIEGYDIKTKADVSALGTDYMQQVVQAIKSSAKTDPDQVSVCILEPGVAFRLTRQEHRATFLFCWKCGDAFVSVRDANGVESYRRKYGFIKSDDGLLKVIKQAFPDDPDVAKLVEAKGELSLKP